MSETCGDFLVERLHQWGVRRIFGYPGDGINGIMGALERAAKTDHNIDFIQARHEEMAAFMACGHAKFTGEVGVCLATENKIKGWKHTDWGKQVDVDVPLNEARPEDYDTLVLPGGVMNPDHLRRETAAVEFVKAFFRAGKPVAAICHGPQMLIEADVVRGRKLTSYPAIKTDLKNAGANWVDEEVVVDNGLVTSRTPDDLDAFNSKMIEEISEGVHTH